MPPTQRGLTGAAVFTAGNVANPTTLTPVLPTHQVGDLLLCYTACRSNVPTVATPTGWTALTDAAATNGRLALFGRIATSAAMANPGVTWSGLSTGTGGTPAGAVCAVFSGMSAVPAVEATGSVESALASATAAAGGTALSTVSDNALVLSLSTRLDDVGTWNAPATYTLLSGTGTGSGADFALAWAYLVKSPTGGSTGNAFGLTGASAFASSGIRIALTPAPVEALATTVSADSTLTGVLTGGAAPGAPARVREFNGTSDHITLTPPAYFSGDFTIVAVVKRDAVAWQAMLTLANASGGNPCLVWEFGPGSPTRGVELNFASHSERVQEDTFATWGVTGAWMLVAVTGNLGSAQAAYRFHRSLNGTTWSHLPASSSSGALVDPENWTVGGTPQMRIGNYDASFNYFDGRIAVEALWVGTILSDPAIEALAGKTKADWAAAGATHLWELSQATGAPVEDYIGNADQTAISGTTVITGDDPPSTIYAYAASGPPATYEDLAAVISAESGLTLVGARVPGLVGALSAQSTLAPDVSSITFPAVALSGDGTLAPTLTRINLAAGALLGEGTAAVTLTTRTKDLAAVVSGESTLVPAITGRVSLAAALSAESVLGPDLTEAGTAVSVNVRQFNGSSDYIRFPVPPYFSGDFTLATVVKRNVANAYQGLLAIATDSSGDPEVYWGFGPSGTRGIQLLEGLGAAANLNVVEDTFATWNSVDWQLVVVTGNLSTGDCEFHRFITTWVHAEPTSITGTPGVPPDWSTAPARQMRFGNYDASFNFLNGRIAAQALWIGAKLTQAEVEALAGGSSSDWAAAGADHIWELNTAATITDLVGGLDQNGGAGTTLVADAMPTALYELGTVPPTYEDAAAALAGESTLDATLGRKTNLVVALAGEGVTSVTLGELGTYEDAAVALSGQSVASATLGKRLSVVTVQVRQFDGVDDLVTLTPPPYFTGPFTLAMVVKRDVVNAWHGLFTLASASVGNPNLTAQFGPTGTRGFEFGLYDVNQTVQQDSFATWALTTWQLVVITGELGAVGAAYRFHRYDGTSWAHLAQTGNNLGATTATPWSQLRMGNWNNAFNFFAGQMAAQALWIGEAMTDPAVEALAGGDRAAWIALGADHLWELSDSPVTDYVGNADQTALAGTTVVTTSALAPGIYLLPALDPYQSVAVDLAASSTIAPTLSKVGDPIVKRLATTLTADSTLTTALTEIPSPVSGQVTTAAQIVAIATNAANAGKTYYMRGGNYGALALGETARPASLITFLTYPGEQVTFTGMSFDRVANIRFDGNAVNTVREGAANARSGVYPDGHYGLLFRPPGLYGNNVAAAGAILFFADANSSSPTQNIQFANFRLGDATNSDEDRWGIAHGMWFFGDYIQDLLFEDFEIAYLGADLADMAPGGAGDFQGGGFGLFWINSGTHTGDFTFRRGHFHHTMNDFVQYGPASPTELVLFEHCLFESLQHFGDAHCDLFQAFGGSQAFQIEGSVFQYGTQFIMHGGFAHAPRTYHNCLIRAYDQMVLSKDNEAGPHDTIYDTCTIIDGNIRADSTAGAAYTANNKLRNSIFNGINTQTGLNRNAVFANDGQPNIVVDGGNGLTGDVAGASVYNSVWESTNRSQGWRVPVGFPWNISSVPTEDMAVSLSAQSSLTPALTELVGATFEDMAVALTAESLLSADLTEIPSIIELLSTTLSGQSTLSVVLTEIVLPYESLVAAPSGESTLAPTVTRVQSLAATLTADATLAPHLAARTTLASALTGESTASGQLQLDVAGFETLRTTLDATATATGALQRTRGLLTTLSAAATLPVRFGGIRGSAVSLSADASLRPSLGRVLAFSAAWEATGSVLALPRLRVGLSGLLEVEVVFDGGLQEYLDIEELEARLDGHSRLLVGLEGAIVRDWIAGEDERIAPYYEDVAARIEHQAMLEASLAAPSQQPLLDSYSYFQALVRDTQQKELPPEEDVPESSVVVNHTVNTP